MTAEQEIFRAFKDLALADTTSGGLFETGGANRLSGGFYLADERPQNRALPRIVMYVAATDRYDGDATELQEMVWRLIVEVDRNKAFGTGSTPEAAGQLANICDRVKTLYDGKDLSTATNWGSAWSAAPIYISRGPYTAPSDDKVVRRVFEFKINACKV